MLQMVLKLPLLYDLMALALQTDSTRVATLEIGGDFESRYFDIKKGYHALSHHGKLHGSLPAPRREGAPVGRGEAPKQPRYQRRAP